MLNYTNPMAMIMWAVLEATNISGVGLCHSVQGTSKQLANYMGVDYDNLRYLVAGIITWRGFLELSQDGETLYPRLNACLEDPEIVARDPVRFEILKHFVGSSPNPHAHGRVRSLLHATPRRDGTARR